jgi:hypothetical protein
MRAAIFAKSVASGEAAMQVFDTVYIFILNLGVALKRVKP